MNKIAIIQYGSVSTLPLNTWDGYLTSETFISKQTNVYTGSLHFEHQETLDKLRRENTLYEDLDPSVLMAIEASRKTMRNIKPKKLLGINIGSSRGATELFEKHHRYFLEKNNTQTLASPTTTLGNISSWVGQDLQRKNIPFSHSITCSTAFHGILNAIAWLESGMCDQFLVGGSEAPLTPFTIAQMQALRVYSNIENDKYPCQSLNLKKVNNTMVLGEGAATFLLEKESSNALAHIIGIGFATESINHHVAVSNDAKCFQESMKMALDKAKLENVDIIVMHAPGTKKGDTSEYTAIQNIFKQLPFLTSNKWKIGHTFGASGALSLEMALLMLEHQQAIESPCTSFEQTPPSITKTIMINAVGFGGNAVSIIISK